MRMTCSPHWTFFHWISKACRLNEPKILLILSRILQIRDTNESTIWVNCGGRSQVIDPSLWSPRRPTRQASSSVAVETEPQVWKCQPTLRLLLHALAEPFCIDTMCWSGWREWRLRNEWTTLEWHSSCRVHSVDLHKLGDATADWNWMVHFGLALVLIKFCSSMWNRLHLCGHGPQKSSCHPP